MKKLILLSMLLLSCKSDNKTYAKKVSQEGKAREMEVLLYMINRDNMSGELTTTISYDDNKDSLKTLGFDVNCFFLNTRICDINWNN
jgi:predicted outer membrane protein